MARLGRPPREQSEGQDKDNNQVARPSIYMSAELDLELDEIASQQGISKSKLVSDLLETLLDSKSGKIFRERAKLNHHSLTQQLQETLDWVNEPLIEEIAPLARDGHQNGTQMLKYIMQQLPSAEILDYARSSRRPPLDMLVFLLELGLKLYKQRFAELDQIMKEIDLK